MHKFVSYNRKILLNSAINLPAISSAALYGKGIFTTLAVYDSKPFLWEKHWRRLIENAEKLGIDLLNFDEDTVIKSLFELIAKNEISNARVRITFFDTSANSIWETESRIKTSLLIQTSDFRAISEKLNLTISPFQINSKSPITNIKSCNYLENILAYEDAKLKVFDEAIRLNECGEIASACLANVFWVKNQKLFTPDLETGCLAGTMREFIIETAIEKRFEMSFVKSNLDVLLVADEVFLTSSALNIASVRKIDDFYFNDEFCRDFNFDLISNTN
jgi:branched-subunit amino acid aminotransferase/4-amino-4-deoxychorismate lyase